LAHFLLEHHAKTYGYAEDGGARKAPYPARSTSGERPTGTNWTADFVGPRVGLDAVEKRKIPVHTGNQTQIIWFAAWTSQKKGKSLSTPEIETRLFGLRPGCRRKKENPCQHRKSKPDYLVCGLDVVEKRKIPVHTGNRTQIIWLAAWTQ